MKEPLILSIDCGTQSTRALLFNKKGTLVGKCKVAFEPYFSLHEGWAEQHASFYWEKFCEATQGLKKLFPAAWENIKAVSVSTLRDTCVCVDKEGNPLRPVILWLDRREASPIKMPLIPKAMFKAAGMYEPMMRQGMVSPCNWIREYEPTVWHNTHKYLMFSGYIHFLLTGKMVDSVANMIGHIPFDYKNKKWLKQGHYRAYPFPVEEEKLFDLVEPGTIIGGITEKAAAETGIPAGIPLVAAGSDKGCETVGTGCSGKDGASLSFGTTATVQFTTEKYVEPATFMPAYPSLVPGRYNPETQIFRGFWMVTWFLQEFADKERVIAAERGVPAEVVLDEMMESIPAGAEGLLLQPYWSPSLKAPEARGAVLGFSDRHTKAHLYRAIIEGIGYGLYEGLKEIERRAGYRLKYVTLSGGGANSEAVCQIAADMSGLPARRVQTYETSGLGAAMIGFIGIGEYRNFEEATENMVHVTKVFEPNKENHERYMKIYHTLYKKMYKQVKPLYHALRAINK